MKLLQILGVVITVLLMVCIVILQRSYEYQKSTNEQVHRIITGLRISPEQESKAKRASKKQDDAFMNDMGKI